MQTQQIIPRRGEGWLSARFKGVDFIIALVELLKNSLDWEATKIWITTSNRKQIVVVDNGVGMSQSNRVSFASINLTTATPGMSGKFDTGSKRFLFAHAKSVTVKTVSTETPDLVHTFVIHSDQYEAALDTSQPIDVRVVKKTSTSWPYEHSTGTELTYEFKEQNSKAILRGRALATKLSARLSILFQDVIRVDGEKLPAKQIDGEVFAVDKNIPQLGEVSLYLYRPHKRGVEDGLHIGSGMISDVSFAAFAGLLRTVGITVPEIFRHPRVCGVISADFFKKYGREDRQGFDASLLDDENLELLLAYFEEIAENVTTTLGLTENSSKASGSDQVTRRLLEVTARAYKTPRPAFGSDGGVEGSVVARTIRQAGDDDSLRVFRLVGDRREYEVGEPVVVGAVFARDFQQKYSPKSLRWVTDDYLGRSGESTATGYKFIAAKVGRGQLTANVAKTAHTASVSYDIVPKGQRVLRLSPQSASVPVGGQVTLRLLNADKAQGRLKWAPRPGLEVADDYLSATFTGQAEGGVTIKVSDAAGNSAESGITVTPARGGKPLLCIRNQFFDIVVQHMDGAPVEILVGDRERRIHSLYINPAAPGYAEAELSGSLDVLLLRAISEAYASFNHFDLLGRDRGDISAVRESQIESWQVLAELLKHLSS